MNILVSLIKLVLDLSDNYEDVWQLVSLSVDITKEEFDRLVRKIYEKSGQMVTLRAAAIVVARDLGINTSVLMHPPIRGRILEVSPVKYTTSTGSETPYVLFTIVNENDRQLCVAFGEEHIKTLKEMEDKPVELRGYTRARLRKYNMIKVTEKSEIVPLDENVVPPVEKLTPAWANTIKQLEENPGAFIVKGVVIEEQISEYFTCPICGKSVDIRDEEWTCTDHGVIEPIMKKIHRYLISDKSGEYPAVYFGELDFETVLNKLIIFKGYMKSGEIQISKIYKVSEEDVISL